MGFDPNKADQRMARKRFKPDFDMNFVHATARMLCPAIAECFIDGLRKAGISD